MKFNKERLKREFKNFNWKREWESLQEDSPQIAKGIKVLMFMLAIVIVTRGCNSCSSNDSVSEVKTEVDQYRYVAEQDSAVLKDKKTFSNQEVKQNVTKDVNQEYKRPDNAYNISIFNEQVKYLYTLPELRDVPVEDIRKAYFDAQEHWYKDFLLKQENGELVNLKKYLD